MMPNGIKLLTALFTAIFSLSSVAQNPAIEPENATSQEAPTTYTHEGELYPPVLFVSNISETEIKETIEEFSAFKALDEDAIGLPIVVRVLKGKRAKQDGASLSTALLAAGTLGLVPVVQNTEFNVYYDVFLQGKEIARFKYTRDSTSVGILWNAANSNQQTKPADVLFLEATVPAFLNDLKENKETQAVFSEYWEYFPE